MARPADPHAREALLAAARAEFVRRGIRGARIEDITAACSLSKGAFYLHFESKEQAFTEILSSTLAEVGEIVNQVHAENEGNFQRGLIYMIEQWHECDVQVFEVIWKHRAVMALVLLEGGGSADYQHLTEMFVQRMELQVESLIAFGVEHGYYRSDLSTGVAAAFCAGGYDRVARRVLRAKKKPDFRHLLKQAQLYVIHALGTPTMIATAEQFYGAKAPDSGLSHDEPRRRAPRSA